MPRIASAKVSKVGETALEIVDGGSIDKRLKYAPLFRSKPLFAPSTSLALDLPDGDENSTFAAVAGGVPGIRKNELFAGGGPARIADGRSVVSGLSFESLTDMPVSLRVAADRSNDVEGCLTIFLNSCEAFVVSPADKSDDGIGTCRSARISACDCRKSGNDFFERRTSLVSSIGDATIC